MFCTHVNEGMPLFPRRFPSFFSHLLMLWRAVQAGLLKGFAAANKLVYESNKKLGVTNKAKQLRRFTIVPEIITSTENCTDADRQFLLQRVTPPHPLSVCLSLLSPPFVSLLSTEGCHSWVSLRMVLHFSEERAAL